MGDLFESRQIVNYQDPFTVLACRRSLPAENYKTRNRPLHYFSQPFFEPSLGQTQRVTALFGAYSDWILNIWDESDVAVRTVTGSGHKLQFDWDGTGDGGSGIPDGVYRYSVTANETNEPPSAPGGGGGGAPPAPGLASLLAAGASDELFPASPAEAMMAGMTSYFVTPPPLPPLKVNGKWYEWEAIYGPVPPIEIQIPLRVQESFLQALTVGNAPPIMAGMMLNGVFTSPNAPTKPPMMGAKNAVGTFGIAYWTYPKGLTNQVPPNGLGGHVTLEVNNTSGLSFTPVTDFAVSAKGFSKAMERASWKVGFLKSDTNLTKNDLIRGDLNGYSGSNLFNRVNLGLLMSHGSYGSTLDYSAAAGQSKQTYLAAGGNNAPNSWIGLSDFRFGQSLRWMAILACNSLQEDSYQSMRSKFVLPIGDQNQGFTNHLHILLGCRTFAAVTPNFGEVFAKKLKGGFLSLPQTVKDAWFNTGKDVYKGVAATNFPGGTVSFKALGWDTTVDSDTLKQFTEPDPSGDSLVSRNQQVFP